jgi:hypothetical protein
MSFDDTKPNRNNTTSPSPSVFLAEACTSPVQRLCLKKIGAINSTFLLNDMKTTEGSPKVRQEGEPLRLISESNSTGQPPEEK